MGITSSYVMRRFSCIGSELGQDSRSSEGAAVQRNAAPLGVRKSFVENREQTLERVESSLRGPAPPIRELLVSQGWAQLVCATTGNCAYGIFVARAVEGTAALERLSLGEFSVASLFARGLSSKEVGAELSLADTTARGALLRACEKLGIRGTQLPLFWHVLESVAPAIEATEGGSEQLRYVLDVRAFLPMALATAERELVLHVLLGRSNAEVAQLRGVSTQTVGNQLHAIFGKLQVASRGELAAYVLSAHETSAALGERRSIRKSAAPRRFGVEDARSAVWLVREEPVHGVYEVGVQRREIRRALGAAVVAAGAAAVGRQRLGHLRLGDSAVGRGVSEARDVRLHEPVGLAVEEEVAGAVGGRLPDLAVGAFDLDFDALEPVAIVFDLGRVVGHSVHGARSHQRRAVVCEMAADALAAG